MTALPEVARSLKSLGTPGDVASQSAHDAIFVPLMEARERANAAEKEIVLAALRGDALAARIEARAFDVAVAGIVAPPRVRSLTARTRELMDALHQALQVLDEKASLALEDVVAWDAWVAQLRRVFSTADAACGALARLIRERDTETASAKPVKRRTK